MSRPTVEVCSVSKASSETITADYRRQFAEICLGYAFGRKLDTMNTSWCEVAVDDETGEVEI
jgi:hypothetical protein